MEKLILEIGMKLNQPFEYYDNMLKQNNFENIFDVEIYDLYYTNTSVENLTENEFKNSCIRLRNVNLTDEEKKDNFKIQNKILKNIRSEKINKKDLEKFEEKINSFGFNKILEASRKDHHYKNDEIPGTIQLQEVDGIGLLVYYDNKNYYHLDETEQRKKLIDELNSYGFNFKEDELGLDKLRTLYYKQEMYSKNQNA